MKRIENTMYLVTEDGRVWSEMTCIFLKHSITHGYPRITLIVNGKKVSTVIHRLVAKHYLENPDNLNQVNHKNGIKTDNRFQNLEWCTSSQNIQHAYDTGLGHVGSKHYSSKLTEDQVFEIRRLYKETNTSYVKLGRLFNIDQSVIGDIINRKTWKQI